MLCGLAAAEAAAAQLPALQADLVKDLATQPSGRGSSPHSFRTLGDRIYFAATDAATGTELYSTNATGDLRFLADIAPGTAGSRPEPVSLQGSRVIVSADDGTGLQLWSLPVEGGQATRLTSLGGPVYRTAAVGSRTILGISGGKILSTDGTPQGTIPLPGGPDFPIDSISTSCAIGSDVILSGSGRSMLESLVRTDGIPGHSSVLTTFPMFARAEASAKMGNYCYFVVSLAIQRQIWRSDGTVVGTAKVTEPRDFSGDLAALGGALYITETTGGATRLLRLAEGESEPQTVVEIAPSEQSATQLVLHDGRLIFDAYIGTGGLSEKAVYISDGTTAGTLRIPSSEENPAVAQGRFYPLNGSIVFDHYGGDLAIGLADGIVTNLGTGALDFSESALLGNVRISSGESGEGREVWISDGSAAGTRRLHDIWQETRSGIRTPDQSADWVSVDDVLFFNHALAPGSDVRAGLWRTDGSESGTAPLGLDFYPGQAAVDLERSGSGLMFLTRSSGPSSVYYTDTLFSSVHEVARADSSWLSWLAPTGGGTGVLFACEPFPGLCRADPDSSSMVGNADFLDVRAVGEIGGAAILYRQQYREFWRSDGSFPGTHLLLSGRELRGLPDRTQDMVLNGRLFFVSCISDSFCNLTSTDGTVPGTALLSQVPSVGLNAAARAGDRLVLGFGAGYDGQLWSTDGTAAGTHMLLHSPVSGFAAAGGWVHMKAECADCAHRYLVTDGTPAGTRPVALPGMLQASGNFIAAVGEDAVVFSCGDDLRGEELCVANAAGTAAGPLPEIFPGEYSAAPRPIGATRSAVYFSAEDGRHGREPWQIRLLEAPLFADGFNGPL
ncbi:hypothetical protein [Tahibacter harae]|uniref:ELWxxDGT repeat protein n=1 Tax=Tahibacter harae TaxID=2963937 RepID=A0ABT1QT22_9GAMM|nr:hypothetical protein [Tahibacter harae]MCQ4165435.1 hypothetical protein [Tahibacter harae]